ncbi:MAG TPA: Hpt domain-containing protein [Hanamia sp.]|nr:Hpt domain-containing protein [Hanamia sp.]
MENLSIEFDQRLDIEFLQSIYEDDMEHALIVFSQFLQMAPPLMKEIEESYKSGVVEPFRQKVHKMKPVFSFVGLTQLTEKAEILEKKCKEISLIYEISDLYNELKNQYSESFPIIQNEVKRLEEPTLPTGQAGYRQAGK